MENPVDPADHFTSKWHSHVLYNVTVYPIWRWGTPFVVYLFDLTCLHHTFVSTSLPWLSHYVLHTRQVWLMTMVRCLRHHIFNVASIQPSKCGSDGVRNSALNDVTHLVVTALCVIRLHHLNSSCTDASYNCYKNEVSEVISGVHVTTWVVGITSSLNYILTCFSEPFTWLYWEDSVRWCECLDDWPTPCLDWRSCHVYAMHRYYSGLIDNDYYNVTINEYHMNVHIILMWISITNKYIDHAFAIDCPFQPILRSVNRSGTWALTSISDFDMIRIAAVVDETNI